MHPEPGAQRLLSPTGSQAAPTATRVRQREVVAEAVPLQISPASHAVPLARHRAPSLPSATQAPTVAP